MPRGVTPRNFALDLKKFGERTEDEARTIFRKIALDLDRAVVLATPVDTGRARGNWFASLNAPSSETTDSTDATGSGAINRAAGIAQRAKLGDSVWLTNNLPYILPLENGSSKQAPQGMVDVNLRAIADRYGGAIT